MWKYTPPTTAPWFPAESCNFPPRYTAKQNTKKEYVQEKKAVRERAKKDGIKFSIAWREYNEAKLAEQKAKEEADKKAKEEAERNKPTVESLLTEIKEILKENK